MLLLKEIAFEELGVVEYRPSGLRFLAHTSPGCLSGAVKGGAHRSEVSHCQFCYRPLDALAENLTREACNRSEFGHFEPLPGAFPEATIRYLPQ